jgi:hypothetical protein
VFFPKAFIPQACLKGQGHDFRIGYKWYGWIGLNEYRVRQLVIIFELFL